MSKVSKVSKVDKVDKARVWLARSTVAGRCTSVALLFTLTVILEQLLPYIALFDHGWAVWWPVNGISIALLVISRRRHWPWILFAITAATAVGQQLGAGSWSESANIAFCNAIEVLIPALVLPRFYDLDKWLQQPKLIWRFILSATLLAPAASSLLSAAYYHLARHQPYWQMVLKWGVSDVVGIIMYTPLVLVLVSPATYELFHWRRLASTLGNLLPLILVSWVVFHSVGFPGAFLISPLLLLVGMRCGFSGSVLAINLLAPITTSATLHGFGPFALLTGAHEPYRILMLQIFLILTLLMALPISVAQVQQHSSAAQLQQAYRQMEALATADGLTGLANRRRFDAALETEWRRAVRETAPIAMLMLDADNFKSYNDLYGHPSGDACLQAIARAIADIPKRPADLVARYGGEEFVILLPGADPAGAYNIAELVRENVWRLDIPHQGNSQARVTISVGCASILPSEELHPACLFELADCALYSAKQNGRNQTRVHGATLLPSAGPLLQPATT